MKKNIVLVDLQYPYGKKKVYLSGSICDIAARLIAAGNNVNIVDFNIDSFEDGRVAQLFGKADIIGVSVIGSPYIPSAIKFARQMNHHGPNKPILFGGQVIAQLNREEFSNLFQGTNAVQIQNDSDLSTSLRQSIPASLNAPFSPIFEKIGNERLKLYLETEFALVIAQGCAYNCDFCGAPKDQKERRVSEANFRNDVTLLCNQAITFGLTTLECYASSLDFFQNPKPIERYLQILSEVQTETGVAIRLRVLSCLGSFLRASRMIENFGELLRKSGLWCIGFGSDGTDEKVWKEENKAHNHFEDVHKCVELCHQIGIRPELLMVSGFHEDGIISSAKNLWYSIYYSFRYGKTIIRPYLAKPFIPGNKGWITETDRVAETIENPDHFFNLDFCTLGSRLTHPRFFHRWLCNLTYLSIIAILTPFGRCTTSPLIPFGRFSKTINRLMPFDR